MNDDALWATVVGQAAAVSLLRASVVAPVHAFLFVGPPGAGREEAARAFAGALFAGSESADGPESEAAARHRRLAVAGQHPDLVHVEPDGRALLVADTERITVEGWRSPVEADRKVIVVDRFDTAEPEAAASLLKTIEEPPATTTFVLLAEEVPAEHVTIASRCFRVDFPPLADDVMVAAMVADGIDVDRAAVLAEAAAGSLSRARLLVDDPALHGRRNAWHSVPSRLDGSGAAVAVLVEELRAMIDDAQAPLVARHEVELEALAEREEAFGTRGSGRRELVDRQRREVRRLRDDELRFGLATISRVYRDAARAASEAGQPVDSAMDATARITGATGELVRNPNETLLLQALLLDLPTAG